MLGLKMLAGHDALVGVEPTQAAFGVDEFEQLAVDGIASPLGYHQAWIAPQIEEPARGPSAAENPRFPSQTRPLPATGLAAIAA